MDFKDRAGGGKPLASGERAAAILVSNPAKVKKYFESLRVDPSTDMDSYVALNGALKEKQYPMWTERREFYKNTTRGGLSSADEYRSKERKTDYTRTSVFGDEELKRFAGHATNLHAVLGALFDGKQFKGSRQLVKSGRVEESEAPKLTPGDVLARPLTYIDSSFNLLIQKTEYGKPKPSSKIGDEKVMEDYFNSVTAIVIGDTIKEKKELYPTKGYGERRPKMEITDDEEESYYKRLNMRYVAVEGKNLEMLVKLFDSLGVDDIGVVSFSQVQLIFNTPSLFKRAPDLTKLANASADNKGAFCPQQIEWH